MAQLSKEKAKNVAGKGGKWERWITSEVTNMSHTGWAPWTFWFFSNSTCQSCHLFFSSFFWGPLCSDVGGSLLCGDNRCLAPPLSQLVFCVVYPACACVSSSWRHYWLSQCVTPWNILALRSDSRIWARVLSDWLVQMCWRREVIFFSHFFGFTRMTNSQGGGWSFGSFASRRITHSHFRLAHIYAHLACVCDCVCVQWLRSSSIQLNQVKCTFQTAPVHDISWHWAKVEQTQATAI